MLDSISLAGRLKPHLGLETGGVLVLVCSTENQVQLSVLVRCSILESVKKLVVPAPLQYGNQWCPEVTVRGVRFPNSGLDVQQWEWTCCPIRKLEVLTPSSNSGGYQPI